MSQHSTRRPQDKIKSIEELAEVITSLRAISQKIVHCHGVFDLLHIGHIRHFQQSKGLGDTLVVTVTQDRYVNKGAQAVATLGHQASIERVPLFKFIEPLLK